MTRFPHSFYFFIEKYLTFFVFRCLIYRLGMVQNAMKQLKLSNPQENNQQNQLQVQSQTSTMGDQSQSIAHSQNQTLTHPTTVQAVKSAVMENLKEITETDVLSRKRFSSAYQLGMTTRFMTFMKVEISGNTIFFCFLLHNHTML